MYDCCLDFFPFFFPFFFPTHEETVSGKGPSFTFFFLWDIGKNCLRMLFVQAKLPLSQNCLQLANPKLKQCNWVGYKCFLVVIALISRSYVCHSNNNCLLNPLCPNSDLNQISHLVSRVY